jgi:hypothetical protein
MLKARLKQAEWRGSDYFIECGLRFLTQEVPLIRLFDVRDFGY